MNVLSVDLFTFSASKVLLSISVALCDYWQCWLLKLLYYFIWSRHTNRCSVNGRTYSSTVDWIYVVLCLVHNVYCCRIRRSYLSALQRALPMQSCCSTTTSLIWRFLSSVSVTNVFRLRWFSFVALIHIMLSCFHY